MVVVGLFGEQLSRRIGRQKTLWLGAGGMSTGAILLCLAPAAWASIASCGLMGLLGALMPSVVPALLADIHGERRDAAFAEATAVAYAFAILAPLATSLFLWLAFGWRYAVILGPVYGVFLLLRFGWIPLAEPASITSSTRAGLPAPYWAYWCLLVATNALEWSALLWAPAFLEHVRGFASTLAAGIAAGFSVGMLGGRLATGRLVQMIPPRYVFFAALLLALFGFAVYWGINQPSAAVAGLFVLGLGIAPLYPLTLSFAIGAAGASSDAASARFMLGVGLAILIAPAALGDLADRVGLRMAHLTLPVLIAASLACFALGQILERRKLAEDRS